MVFLGPLLIQVLKLDIKRISRTQTIKIVKKYDHVFPINYLSNYCKYFNINKKQFFKILDSHKNNFFFLTKIKS